MPAFVLVVFLGSFLLFQIQPIIGKYILPWYGGAPSVWTTCMLFFPMLLLAGYGYAHLITFLERKKQGCIHLVLLISALWFLPISPAPDVWKLLPGEMPVLKILLLLSVTIGFPYLLLSATAPLVQHWFVCSFPERSPYRLYAVSNFGSLLGLLSYPLAVEPNFTLAQQVKGWGWGFSVFVICCAWCGIQPFIRKTSHRGCDPGNNTPPTTTGASAIPLPLMLIWLGLSTCGSGMLIATTNQLCQDVAVVPFLWITPLVIYLLTFMICFNNDRANNRLVWGTALVLSIIAASSLLSRNPVPPLWLQVSVSLLTLFVCCMACHGELARFRPNARHLTAYYLIIATGGAVGGIIYCVLVPAVFVDFWEYPLTLVCVCLLMLLAWHRDGVLARNPLWLRGTLVAGLLALIIFTGRHIFSSQRYLAFSHRNFFGVLQVRVELDEVGKKLKLYHGNTNHGWQYTDKEKKALPTTYYGPDSGAGLALRFHPHRFAKDLTGRSLRVGVVGLGAGTLATYGREGDYFRFYEINPAVIWLADNLFTFKRDSAAQVDFVPGDARVMMESELQQSAPQELDVLVLDAFSSDAVPVHLLTRECFNIYRQHLKPDGLLVVHTSNSYLSLVPVIRTQGKDAGFLSSTYFFSRENTKIGVVDAEWMILAMNEDFLKRQEVMSRVSRYDGPDIKVKPWTDDFSSLWQILIF